MKGLITLIKIHKRDLDDLRRKMVALENQKAQLLQASAKLSEELVAEIQTASKSPEMGRFFGDFSNRIKKRKEEIAKEVQLLDKQMDVLNNDIRAAFSELKKYEIALERVKLRAKTAEERKETIELDEIAGQQHQRKGKDGG